MSRALLLLAASLLLAGLPLRARADGAADDDAPSPAAQACYDQGLRLEKAGQFEAAADEYRAALAADPGFAKAMRELGRCEVKLGWKGQALEQLQAYQASDAEDDEQVDKMVDFLTQQGGHLGALPLADRGGLGLGLELGYAWGFTNASFGRNYNENGNADLMTYTYDPGEGVSAALEATYKVNSALTLGLAAMPLNTAYSASETLVEGQPGGVTTTADISWVRHFALPVLLRMHTSALVGKAVRVSSFAGAGVIFTQPYVETSTYKTSDSAGDYTTSSRYQRDLQDGMAFQAGLGAEMPVGEHCLLYLKGSLFLAHLPATAATYLATTTDDATGKVVATSYDSATYVSSPPPSVTGATASTTGNTTTFDDGVEQYTLVRHPLTGARDFNETQILSSTAGNDDVNFKLIALAVGLRWEF